MARKRAREDDRCKDGLARPRGCKSRLECDENSEVGDRVAAGGEKKRTRKRTALETLGEVLHRQLVVLEARLRKVVQPSKLLQDFGVVRRVDDYTLVGLLGAVVLRIGCQSIDSPSRKGDNSRRSAARTHVQSGSKCRSERAVPAGL